MLIDGLSSTFSKFFVFEANTEKVADFVSIALKIQCFTQISIQTADLGDGLTVISVSTLDKKTYVNVEEQLY